MYSNGGIYIPGRKPPMGAVRNPHLSINQGLVLDSIMWEGAGNTVEDLSGNGNTGTLAGNTHWVPGKFGSALDFDGTGDYVDVGTSDLLNFTGNHTIVAWIKGAAIAHNDVIFQRIGASPYPGYSFTFEQNNQLEYYNANSGPVQGTAFAAGYYNGVWRQVAVAIGAGGGFYTDGKKEGSSSGSGPDSYPGATALIAGNTIASYYDLDGQIDHFLIYNRVLIAYEIALLYREPFCGFRWTSIIELASYVAAAGGIEVLRRRMEAA